MKATGEAMAIGQSVEEALMKAVRGAEIGMQTLSSPLLDGVDARARLSVADDLRLFTVYKALKEGVSPEEINAVTKIDLFFIHKLKNLADYEALLAKSDLTDELYLRGKKLGFTDESIAALSGQKIRSPRLPSYKMVDTCAGEFAAATPYFYSCYDDYCEARAHIAASKKHRKKIIVLGSGPIRIGQGIEFDYSSVHCAQTLRKLGYEVIIINNNPETVSTDFDVSDRLYFEPLTKEDVWGVIEAENPIGVVVAFGGQTAIKLAKFLDAKGIRILGTSAEGIDTAEDRERFDRLLSKFRIKRPKGLGVKTMEQALRAAESIGYPVLLRPSYVIGGQNMTIAYGENDVRAYMDIILSQGIENPVLIDKYMSGIELEVDVISDGADVLIPGIMEHIERAGVHSGDSIAIYPPQNISDKMIKTIEDSSCKLAQIARHEGAGQYPVPHLGQRAVRHRGQPPRLAHGAVHQQGDQPAAGRRRHARDARREAEGPRLRQRPVQNPALCGGQGAGVLVREAIGRQLRPRAGDEIDRRSARHRAHADRGPL